MRYKNNWNIRDMCCAHPLKWWTALKVENVWEVENNYCFRKKFRKWEQKLSVDLSGFGVKYLFSVYVLCVECMYAQVKCAPIAGSSGTSVECLSCLQCRQHYSQWVNVSNLRSEYDSNDNTIGATFSIITSNRKQYRRVCPPIGYYQGFYYYIVCTSIVLPLKGQYDWVMATLCERQQYALTSHLNHSIDKSLIFVKLTDSALKAIEDYLNHKVCKVLDYVFSSGMSLEKRLCFVWHSMISLCLLLLLFVYWFGFAIYL